MTPAPSRVEVVRGRLDRAVADELLDFWARRGVLSGEKASARLPEVVCVLRINGRLAGACSVFAADVELIGKRRFWVYRSLLDDSVTDQEPAMVRATFDVLDAERRQGWQGEEFGLCLLLDSEALRRFPPDAEWRDPRFIYAGYLPDGRQVRIAYFTDQAYVSVREGGWDPPPGYRIDLFAEQDEVSRADVVELWTSAGVLTREQAELRVDEVLVVATDPERRLIGVSTAYLERNEQLRARLWHYRTFVVPDRRAAHFSIMMVLAAREHLEDRFVSGADRRGIGLLFEIEYEPWKRIGEKGLWVPSDTLLIGDNQYGDHVRVHYFLGALAPELA